MDKVIRVEKVACSVEDDRGVMTAGFVFLADGVRIKDLLDDDRNSIAVECADGQIRLMNKRFIRAVNLRLGAERVLSEASIG